MRVFMMATTPTSTILPVSRAPSSFVPLKKADHSTQKHRGRGRRSSSPNPGRNSKRTYGTTRTGRSPSQPHRFGTVRLVDGTYTYTVPSSVDGKKRSRSRRSPRRTDASPRRRANVKRTRSRSRSRQRSKNGRTGSTGRKRK